MNKVSLFLLDLIFPNKCPICDEFIAFDSFLCDKCLEKLKAYTANEGSFCKLCGKNICSGHKDLYYSRIIACYNYEDIVKNGIYSLKEDSKNFGYHIGKLLADKITADSLMCKADFIVPVPMAKKNLRERGYNQAYVIAKEISQRTGIKILNNVLFKKPSEIQHNLTAEERQKNVSAFYCKNADLSGKKIIICDDVLTTGSTMNRCAQLLKSMNASEVYGASGAITVNKAYKPTDKEKNRAMALIE